MLAMRATLIDALALLDVCAPLDSSGGHILGRMIAVADIYLQLHDMSRVFLGRVAGRPALNFLIEIAPSCGVLAIIAWAVWPQRWKSPKSSRKARQ